ncbi:FAD:protein FMN transferase, partial [Sedimentibacter sp. B4]|uniref:FAD:protein FMN transferase n=1 Tax=Sedimentibacter sp. B4 TaxID=304766 RepID=UPI0005934ED3
VALSLGGDVAVSHAGRPTWWPIEIRDHPDAEGTVEVAIAEGGLATSSTVVRRWTAGGVIRHHLVDPRTGESARTRWRTVSATGPSATAANVATTAAVILGDDAIEWLTRRSVAARLVSEDGTVTLTAGWPGKGVQR